MNISKQTAPSFGANMKLEPVVRKLVKQHHPDSKALEKLDHIAEVLKMQPHQDSVVISRGKNGNKSVQVSYSKGQGEQSETAHVRVNDITPAYIKNLIINMREKTGL